MPTDRRPPDTEAIRAAHELDLPAMRDFANEMRAGTGDDLGPMFFRDVARLVARLEAAGQVDAAARVVVEEWCAENPFVGYSVEALEAALAAAAPGEGEA